MRQYWIKNADHLVALDIVSLGTIIALTSSRDGLARYLEQSYSETGPGFTFILITIILTVLLILPFIWLILSSLIKKYLISSGFYQMRQEYIPGKILNVYGKRAGKGVTRYEVLIYTIDREIECPISLKEFLDFKIGQQMVVRKTIYAHQNQDIRADYELMR